jgi:hypothetical protein
MDKFINLCKNWNVNGVYLPMVSDPSTQRGSISATLVFISSIAVLASLVTVKVNNNYAFDFFLASCSLYFGRKLTAKSGTSVDTK